MISLVHIVKQKQTHGKERESDQLGYTADPKVRNCQAKRAVVPKRLIQLLARCSLLNILRTFSQNTFMVGRNQIYCCSYPILSYHFQRKHLPGITGYCNSRNRSTIVAL